MKIGLVGAPIWQGQAIIGVDDAPFVLRHAGLVKWLSQQAIVCDYGDIAAAAGDRAERTGSVRQVAAVAASVTRLRDKVSEVLKDGCLPIILGGDHSMAIGTLAAMLKQYPSLGVIWFDAHADINTPETSPSGNIHGMPLSAAMGLGDARLTAVGADAPRLSPRNLVYIGLRDVDPGEAAFLETQGIRSYSTEDVRRMGMSKVMEEALHYLSHCDGIHLSFDYDGLDPQQFAAVGTPVAEGMTLDEGRILLDELRKSGRLTSADFVEYNPVIAPAANLATTALELIGNLFGAEKNAAEADCFPIQILKKGIERPVLA